MSISIWRGICRGGPLDGQDHTQTTRPPTIAGIFDYESSLTKESGRYTYMLSRNEWEYSADKKDSA